VATFVVIHQVELNRLLRSPAGPVARDALRRARNVQVAARRNVHSRSGRLAASIQVELRTWADGVLVRVGSNLGYALVHHEGRGPVSADPGSALAFTAGGRTVIVRSVGAARGNPYLRRALDAARH
jgi:hypothetical protein